MTLLFRMFVCAMLFLVQGPIATSQDSLGSSGGSAVSSVSGSLKIVKLLWKSNPSSAATTLAKSISVAIDRDQAKELREGLSPLKELFAQSASDASDPRHEVSLVAIAFVDAANRDAMSRLQKAIEGGSSPHLDLLVRTWFTVDHESAFQFLTQQIGQPSKALAALTQYALTADRKRAAEILLTSWSKLPREQQVALIEPLTAQSATMLLLVQAVRDGKVNRELVNTNQLRKWQSSNDVTLATAIESVWGRIRESDNAERQKLVQERLALLRDKSSKGSVARGQAVFTRACAQCHQLHGNGLEVGPNITSNGRGNLDQLISNILDPSLVIGNAFQARTVLTTDGEVVAGLVVADDERYLRLKVQGGKVIEFDKANDVDQVKVSTKSLMPEGLEEQMTQQEFIDLCAYLCLVKAPNEADNELISGTPVHLVNE